MGEAERVVASRQRSRAFFILWAATVAASAVAGSATSGAYSGAELLLMPVVFGSFVAWFYFDGRASDAPGVAAWFVAMIVCSLGTLAMLVYFVLTRGMRGFLVWLGFLLALWLAAMLGAGVRELVGLAR